MMDETELRGPTSALATSHVSIHTMATCAPSTPGWFGEVAVLAQHLRHVGVLATIQERVRFAWRRFG